LKLEATERWTEVRLVALAAALHLPCPVREGFLFDADHAFRVSCTESDITLQRAIKRVFEHAGVRCDAAVVLWKVGLGAAKVDRDGDSWFFEIDAASKTNAEMLGVILAREAARALVAERKVVPAGGVVGAADRELAAMLCGLGALILRGVDADPSVFALRPRLLRYAYARVARSLALGLSRGLDVLPARLHVTLLWPRISRRALPFRALEPTVIIRCFCMRRLRVPTGAIGATTCPACKRKRPFDGRACRIETLAAARALPPAHVPVATPWQRLAIAFVELPLAARVTAMLIVALVAMMLALR
jgi:hypothetical protein